MDVNYDPESPDAEPLSGEGEGAGISTDAFDLSPRTGPAPERSGGVAANSTRRYVAIGVLVAILAALGFVLYVGLSDAATFFYNVDEAVAQRDELQGERIRMQGNVVAGSVTDTADGVEFVISFGGEEVPVSHTGTPPELFGPEIPVVIEGSFTDGGERFESDEILVRHDNEYDEEHPERIDDAERDAQASGGDG